MSTTAALIAYTLWAALGALGAIAIQIVAFHQPLTPRRSLVSRSPRWHLHHLRLERRLMVRVSPPASL